jgi:outer membrane protein
MKKRWFLGFVLVMVLVVGSWGMAISQTGAPPKSGTNGAKGAVHPAGATSTSQAKTQRIVDVRLEKNGDLTQFTVIGDGEFGKYETLKLGSPTRLVLDIKDADTRYPNALVKNENPLIREVRIGRHPDKVRFVFYPEGNQVPPFEVKRDKDRLVVSFGNSSKTPAAGLPAAPARQRAEKPVPAKDVKTAVSEKIPGVTEASLKLAPTSDAKTEPPAVVAQLAAPVSKPAETPAPVEPAKEPPTIRMTLSDAGVKPDGIETLTMEESIRIALSRSLILDSAIKDIDISEFRTKEARADFLPKWTGQYTWTRSSQETLVNRQVRTVVVPQPAPLPPLVTTVVSVTNTRDISTGSTSVSQPVFAGGSILANYRLEKLGIDLSKADVETTKRDIVLQVRVNYYLILTAEKAVEVAQQTVKQFEAQLEVSKALFEVGIVAKNDVLQAEVGLANAKQGLVKAENAVASTKAGFNRLLRRDVSAPVRVVDILEQRIQIPGFEESVDESLRYRPEVKAAQISIEQAREVVKIAQSGYFPSVSLVGNLNKTSEELLLNGDLHEKRWTVQALASYTLFEWGKTAYTVGENKVKVSQLENAKKQLVEGIVLEVKQAYLDLLEAEKNIGTAQKATEQAQENLRLNEERYKYQVATATDVTVAVTLLDQAGVNYYTALGSFNIAKARLDRAMGKM